MRLTDHTDYSLRVLMHLNQNKKIFTLSTLSKELNISRNNLIKISNQFAKFGFIETTRGRKGGIWLREGTEKVTLKTIIQKTEESFNIAGCFSDKKISCTFINGCILKKSLNEALNTFFNTLGQITLNDVTPKKNLYTRKGD